MSERWFCFKIHAVHVLHLNSDARDSSVFGMCLQVRTRNSMWNNHGSSDVIIDVQTKGT